MLVRSFEFVRVRVRDLIRLTLGFWLGVRIFIMRRILTTDNDAR